MTQPRRFLTVAELEQTVGTADEYVRNQAPREAYVTGSIPRLDLRTGLLEYINAGQPAPLLVRDGTGLKQLNAARCPILGFGAGAIAPAREQLEPGDCLLFYTDGITEAREAGGRFFGLDRLIRHVERSVAVDLPAPETLRRLSHDVLAYQQGLLQDDATLVLVQWTSEEEHRYTPSFRATRRPADGAAPAHRR